MSYGQDFPDFFRRAAAYTDRILKGAKPADLPVEQPTKLKLVLNRKTEKAIGITSALRISVWGKVCDFDLDIACGGGIEEALEAAMALGPTSRALQDQRPETRAAVAASIRRALQPYQRGKQVALAGAIWLVTANNA